MGTFLTSPQSGQKGTCLPKARPLLLGNEECPHKLALDGAMLRFPCEVVAFQVREAREPGRMQYVSG